MLTSIFKTDIYESYKKSTKLSLTHSLNDQKISATTDRIAMKKVHSFH